MSTSGEKLSTICRSVCLVGCASFADSKDRLERVLRDESPGQVTRLRRLAMESARIIP
jgi:hypothetical protein